MLKKSKTRNLFFVCFAFFIIALSFTVYITTHYRAKNYLYKSPITGTQIIKTIDTFFGLKVDNLDWTVVVTEQSGRKTFVLSDLHEIKLSPVEAFGEGNSYCYRSDIQSGYKAVFPEGIESISVTWDQYTEYNHTSIGYFAQDNDVDGIWDQVLIIPEYGSKYNLTMIKLKGTNATANSIEEKWFLKTLLQEV